MRYHEIILERAGHAQAALYPHSEGADIYGGTITKFQDIPIHLLIGNEPFKDRAYFSMQRLYQRDLMRHIKAGKPLNHLIGIQHPANPRYVLIIDGNHRLDAYRHAGVTLVPVDFIDYNDIYLLVDRDQRLDNTKLLLKFRSPDGKYNMIKPRVELNGLTLGDYFAAPRTP